MIIKSILFTLNLLFCFSIKADEKVELWHDQYLNLLNSQDISLISKFSDDCTLKVIKHENQKLVKEITLKGSDVITALEASWQMIKKLEDIESVENRKIQKVSKGVFKISGTRKSKLKCTEDPSFEMTVREKGEDFEIIELQETSEKYYQCPNKKGLTTETLLLIKDYEKEIAKIKLPIRFDDYSMLKSIEVDNLQLKIGLGINISKYDLRHEVEQITESFKLLMCEFPFNSVFFEIGGNSLVSIDYIYRGQLIKDSFTLTRNYCEDTRVEVDKDALLSVLEKTIHLEEYPKIIDENTTIINASIVNEKLILNYELKELNDQNQGAFENLINELKNVSKEAFKLYVKNGVPVRLVFSKEGKVVKILDVTEEN